MEHHLSVLAPNTVFSRNKLSVFIRTLERLLASVVLLCWGFFEYDSVHVPVCALNFYFTQYFENSLKLKRGFMPGREKEQILTQKQLFKGKGKLFCFFLDFYSDGTIILFSQDFVISGKKTWYCLTSSFSGCVFCFFFFFHSFQRKC